MHKFNPTTRWLRKAYQISNILGTALLIVSFALGVIPPRLIAADSGAIWTTNATCEAPSPQDDNHYAIGEDVWLRFDDFASGQELPWTISGLPGGASADPGIVVAQGTITADENGYACLNAYTVQPDDGGEYKAASLNKQDNYQVDPAFSLQVTKTAATSYTRTYLWTIDKSVSLDYFDLQVGDPGVTSNYAITVDQSGYSDSDFTVSGAIEITNPAGVPAQIEAVTDLISGGYSADVDCAVSFPYTLPAGGTLTCTYTANLPDASNRTNTASVAVSDQSFVLGGSGTAPVDFSGAVVSEEDAVIHVTDVSAEFGDQFFTFSGDGSQTYTRDFSCDVNSIGRTIYENTATIDETGGFDTASVTVDCGEVLDLLVSKTAETSFTRTYRWQIEKTANPSILSMLPDDPPESVVYLVSVDQQGHTDSDWEVSGDITIQNPAEYSAVISQVVDIISYETGPAIPAPVDCGQNFPISLAPGGSLTCTYNAGLPNGTTRTNTALVSAETRGVDTSASATAEVIFSEPSIKINDTVHVSDTYYDTVAQPGDPYPWEFTGSSTVAYTRAFACPADAGTHPNTAAIMETHQSDTASVEVNCEGLWALTIEKTAFTDWTRTYEWEISKSADPVEHDLYLYESASTEYSVTVTKADEPIDSDWTTWGEVLVTNNTPYIAVVKRVTDSLEGYGLVELDCDAPPEHALHPGDVITCTYEVDLTRLPADILDNTAAVEVMPGYTGDEVHVLGASITVPVDFSGEPDPVNIIGDEIDVYDSYYGVLGTGIDETTTFTYARVFTCGSLGTLTYNNIASILDPAASASASVAVTCNAVPALVVSKTAETAYTLTYPWTIEKTVDPAYHNLWSGDGGGRSTYTVAVERGTPLESNWAVSGEITITNPAPFIARINNISDVVSGSIEASVSCPQGIPFNLAGGATIVCTYSTPLPDRSARTNTVTVSVSGASVVEGGSDTESVSFTNAEVSEVNAVIHVTDVNDVFPSQTWEFDSSDTVTYDREFFCGITEGSTTFTIGNVATISETGQAASAQVVVDCDAVPNLVISKTAATSFTRTWTWNIDKSVAPAAWEMNTGMSGTSTYTVAVTKVGAIDSAWQVTGQITITNPATDPEPLTATITAVEDTLSNGVQAEVDCGDTVVFPYPLPAGQSLVCNYSAALVTAPPLDLKNTASAVTLAGSLVDGNQITIPITFGDPALENFASVTVSDSNGMGWDFSASGVKTYTRTFTCDEDEGTQDNTATIIQTGQEDDARVIVNCDAPVTPTTPTTPTTTTTTTAGTPEGPQDTPSPEATLPAPESTSQVLIPVTGFTLPNPFKDLSILLFQLGLAVFGLGFVFRGLSKRED